MLWETALIVSGSIAYMLLNDKDSNTTKEKDKIQDLDNFTETFEYFKNLPLSYQLGYISYNYDLAPYLEDMSDNTYLNAYKVAKIAKKLNKSFTNDNKRY